jgi:hypothetical protein
MKGVKSVQTLPDEVLSTLPEVIKPLAQYDPVLIYLHRKSIPLTAKNYRSISTVGGGKMDEDQELIAKSLMGVKKGR